MLTIMTKDIRDRELKEFLVDAIHQCFHVLDTMDGYRKKRDKCSFAQSIVSCLSEHARANCEDFMEEIMIF